MLDAACWILDADLRLEELAYVSEPQFFSGNCTFAQNSSPRVLRICSDLETATVWSRAESQEREPTGAHRQRSATRCDAVEGRESRARRFAFATPKALRLTPNA